MTISWEALGPPTEPGDIRIEGVGIVDISQDDIDRANRIGGNPEFDLIDATTMNDDLKRFKLGQAS